MSYVALATDRFDEVVRFYGETLGFPAIRGWDRPNGRGQVFHLNGLRIEILDATREPVAMRLEPPGNRVYVVIEVADVHAIRAGLPADAPEPEDTSWGTRVLKLKAPDGVPVWFLQWLRPQG
ncbi:MAG: VOC family protein [Isosphaeraceae bacterium]